MKLLRIIGLLVFMFVFWQATTNALVADTARMEVCTIEGNYVSMAQQPQLPEAEFGVFSTTVQLFAHSRTLRTGSTYTSLSLKELLTRLAQRLAAVRFSIVKGVPDILFCHNFHFACDYYIFSLRRILL